MKIALHATDLLYSANLVVTLPALGHEVKSHAVVQDLCSALYRSPEAVGIIASSSSAFAALTVRGFRSADVKNCLFVLIDQDGRGVEAAAAERIASLAAGADDAQPLSIDPLEIHMRLAALGRRGTYNDHQLIKMPGCHYDATSGFVERDDGGKPIRLTPSEGKLLMEFARQPGVTLTKEVLIDRLYGDDEAPIPKIIDVFICKLRNKLKRGLTDGLEVIETRWGRGFAFVPDGFVPRYRNQVRVAR
ncbi:winged helix-turn-helix domain-containing protein [Mesorhizobium amorphae]